MINLHISPPVGLTGCTWPNSLQAAFASSSSASSQSTANCPLMKSVPLLVLPPPATGVHGVVEWLAGGGERTRGWLWIGFAGGFPPTLAGLGISLAHTRVGILHSLRVYLNFFPLPFQSSTPVPHSHCPPVRSPVCPLVRPSDYFRCLNKFANGFGLFELRFGAASR